MKCDIRCFAEGNYSVSNSTHTYAYYDQLSNQLMQFNLHIKIVYESKYVRIYQTKRVLAKALMNLSHLWNSVSTVSSLPGYNVSQSSVLRPLNGPEMAVDNDYNSCAVTEKGVNGYWRIQFNQTLTVKGMILRLKGGMFFYCCVF